MHLHYMCKAPVIQVYCLYYLYSQNRASRFYLGVYKFTLNSAVQEDIHEFDETLA